MILVNFLDVYFPIKHDVNTRKKGLYKINDNSRISYTASVKKNKLKL